MSELEKLLSTENTNEKVTRKRLCEHELSDKQVEEIRVLMGTNEILNKCVVKKTKFKTSHCNQLGSITFECGSDQNKTSYIFDKEHNLLENC